MQVGDELVNKATAAPVRNVAPQISNAANANQTGKGLAERGLNQPAAKLSLDTATSNLDALKQSVTQLTNAPGLSGITGSESYFPNYRGGQAADAQAMLENIKSKAGFIVLQAMRDASKTGGALGQVSDYENKILQNNLASLEQSQSLPQFKENLKKLLDYVDGAKTRLKNAYDQTYGLDQAIGGAMSPPAGGATKSFDWTPDGGLKESQP
jgi:hypothetical protein